MRFAVLGLGSAGTRHARNLVELGHDVVAFDPAAEAAPDGCERVGDLDGAISRAEAVVVASPSALHAEQALAALAAGRHVLVEKPLATTAADAVRVLDRGRTAGVVSGVAMNLRFLPAVVALKQLVERGDLGELYLAEAVFGYDLRRWRPAVDYRASYSARAELGGGIVLDAIHELDYLLWLFGVAAEVSAATAKVSALEIDVEDVALAAVRFRSGVLASVSLNFFEPVYRRGCTIVGSEAVARWSWGEPEVSVTGADGVPVGGDVQATYVDVLRDFVGAVEDGRAPRTTLEEGVRAVELAEAIKHSSAEGRRISFDPS